jgi:hypothetical protein
VRARNGPPEGEEPGPTPETGPNHKELADTTTNQRNRTATDRQARAYEAAASHLLGHGLTPAPNVPAMRAMWKRGGPSRRAAELIAEAWKLPAA